MNSKVHVYGHSMGAHLALNLALQYPDLVVSVIASGAAVASRYPFWKRVGMVPFIYTPGILLRTILPKQRQIQFYNYTMKPANDTIMADILSEPIEGNWRACREICSSIKESLPVGKPVNIKARTLVIAATATIGDTVDDVKYLVDEIRKAGGDAVGVEIKEGGHPWDLQLPELCATIIKAWVEGNTLPPSASIVE